MFDNNSPLKPLNVFFPYFLFKEVEGEKFKFYIGDTDGREWYHLGATDPLWLEMRFLKEMIIHKDDIVFECGAHHGCTTILLSRWVGQDGKIVAFEPNPANCEIAKINLNTNCANNVELFNYAVGSDSSEISLDVSSSNSVISIDNSLNENQISSKCIRLDSFENIKPNVLKIDVEGYEKEVLAGAKSILKYNPKLEIEIHPDLLIKYNASVDEIFDLINTDNYLFWIQWQDNEFPIPYNFERRIDKRVHLFALPKMNCMT